LIPKAILPADPLEPFEQTILSNKFSFDHFHGYMNILLPLMKKENLTAFVLDINEADIRRTLSFELLVYHNIGKERKNSYVLSLFKGYILCSTVFECPFDQQTV
jgi:hypothetical protein